VTRTARDAIDVLSTRLAGERFAKGVYGYTTRQFATEPASFALLALRGRLERQLLNNHVRVLTKFQRRDGFWPAVDRDSGPGVWATAVAVNTLVELSSSDRALRLGIHALLNGKPQEAHWLYRLKFRTTDTHVRFDPTKYGWGWVPGTISWIIPTAMALIALERSRKLDLVRAKDLERRLDLAYAMLFDRMCPGGGWNAGNSVVYNVALAPHIDASAIALAALRKHSRNAEVEQSLSCLVSAVCSSAYSLAWKILALRSYVDIRPDLRAVTEVARGQLISVLEDPPQSTETTTLALSILALRDDMNPFAAEPAWRRM
jgi:hypothetical protein